MKTNLKQTNYVIVLDFEEGMYLEDAYLLGWDCHHDWFADTIDACDIITPKGNIKKNQFGLIDVTRLISAYVGETAADCQDHADSGNREGYNCTVCKIEKNAEGDWILIPVRPTI